MKNYFLSLQAGKNQLYIIYIYICFGTRYLGHVWLISDDLRGILALRWLISDALRLAGETTADKLDIVKLDIVSQKRIAVPETIAAETIE